MKTVKQVLAVVFMLTIVTGYANDVKNEPTSSSATFRFLNVKKGHQVSIKNDEGRVIHRETVKRNGDYAKRFDLSDLEDGNYTIELDKDFEIIIKPFKMVSNEVILLSKLQTSIFKPVVRTKKNHLMISKLALNNESLNIELYYNDELIHKDELKGAKILERIYTLSPSEEGIYVLRMSSGDRTFVERFRI
ncbi:hypothetical protein ESY86_07265 [Subsaximicrobium wynnwilliamsii]|uniref:T9SS type A sorting domain-containing protein n=1 Tax=Subsaximicrobium wynnwilliamsii TaxID=291179 RepID=A0A5C6ZHD3_9FLAO|nr:hypothetical protein [Subsaximicrobium wynnwilliamsii]TXD83837.1 hypothetical protein ESY87_07425 [Subsaximicrobium wynnwilliamsii]TXD89578.1 hypothetical protein ESY86_07265 [Subsaximicrobium wynnwilliamsii]TXE02631.1 hypothetical protein ESY88_11580 [Subsaximicrobium wynnwilliamsii]